MQHNKILDINVAKICTSRAQHILDPGLSKEPVRGKVVVHLGGTTLSESRDIRLLNAYIKVWGQTDGILLGLFLGGSNY